MVIVKHIAELEAALANQSVCVVIAESGETGEQALQRVGVRVPSPSC